MYLTCKLLYGAVLHLLFFIQQCNSDEILEEVDEIFEISRLAPRVSTTDVLFTEVGMLTANPVFYEPVVIIPIEGFKKFLIHNLETFNIKMVSI